MTTPLPYQMDYLEWRPNEEIWFTAFIEQYDYYPNGLLKEEREYRENLNRLEEKVLYEYDSEGRVLANKYLNYDANGPNPDTSVLYSERHWYYTY